MINKLKNRIEINGVWYVREEQPSQKIEWDPTCFSGRVYESDLYCFEATQILQDDGTPYDGCDIEITDKREKPWKVEHIDNPPWYIGVLNNDPESMEEAYEIFCEQGLNEFKSVIEDLVHIGWVKK